MNGSPASARPGAVRAGSAPSGAARPGPASPGAGRAGSACSVTVVIPALNEERNLEQLLPLLPEEVDELIVVDGNSSDGTAAVVRRLRPDALLIAQPASGKGDALAAGFAAASGECVVMMDADGSNDPAEIPRFVAALRKGAGFAKGSRFVPGGGSSDITLLRTLGNRFLRTTVNLLYRTRYTDLCYGFNAFSSECLRALDVRCEGFEVEALISCQMARAGVAVEEVPSFEHPRLHGSSNLRPLRDGLRILGIILRERLHRHTPAPGVSPRAPGASPAAPAIAPAAPVVAPPAPAVAGGEQPTVAAVE